VKRALFALVALVGCAASGSAPRARGPVKQVRLDARTGPALLVQLEGGLMPLACYHRDKRAVVGGDACVLGEPRQVERADGKFEQVIGQRFVYCQDERAVQVLRASGSWASFELALSPPDRRLELERVDVGSADPAEPTAAATLLGGLLGATPAKLEVKRFGALDLDGDGHPDDVYTAQGELAGGTGRITQVAALIADFGEGRLYKLAGGLGAPEGGLELIGSADLGADGAHELIIREWWSGGTAAVLITVDKERQPMALSAFVCAR